MKNFKFENVKLVLTTIHGGGNGISFKNSTLHDLAEKILEANSSKENGGGISLKEERERKIELLRLLKNFNEFAPDEVFLLQKLLDEALIDSNDHWRGTRAGGISSISIVFDYNELLSSICAPDFLTNLEEITASSSYLNESEIDEELSENIDWAVREFSESEISDWFNDLDEELQENYLKISSDLKTLIEQE